MRLLILSFGLAYICEASRGDNTVYYHRCTKDCREAHDCPDSFSSYGWSYGECFRCKNKCMWETVEIFESHVGYVPQFHGKWPFVAIDVDCPFGFFHCIIQEPASVVFSLMNLMTFTYMDTRVRNMRNLENRDAWLALTRIGMATWVSSTLFHARDFTVTEYMDYFSAFAFVLVTLYTSLRFVYPQLTYTGNGRRLNKFLIAGLIIWYVGHVCFMLKKFLYGFNMAVCIGCSVVSALVYCYHIYSRYRDYGSFRPSDIALIRVLVWMNAAVVLEILDFVPVFWIFDSHSLFHLATVPVPFWYCDFLEQRQSEMVDFTKKLVEVDKRV
ncbi:unnamed protein product [Caenorhabditis auriculariae]|uniref:Post-GPI attachment to proteins factor 3 n=1 Tax=Caenorhabditis auriculariae TaxID=2777116 RepID=A0A8S1HX99_9PELO|nr:unnamed protein product [Caenorhabditis auriculariae]